MLILTRRIGESLVIGDNVRIRILGIKGRQIRLGIDAPKEVSVHREEIYKRIQLEQEMKNSGYEQEQEQPQEVEQEQEEEQNFNTISNQ